MVKIMNSYEEIKLTKAINESLFYDTEENASGLFNNSLLYDIFIFN